MTLPTGRQVEKQMMKGATPVKQNQGKPTLCRYSLAKNYFGFAKIGLTEYTD